MAGKKKLAKLARKAEKALAAANAAGVVTPSIFAEGVRLLRQSRFNPIRTLAPETLAMAIDNFEAGNVRDLALLFDAISKRCDTTASVKAKREKDTAQRAFQVLTVDDSPAAKDQAAKLEYFYNNVTATNAYDRNERGGFSRLVRQMMEALSYRYANHHIVWQPRPEGLTATLEYVPLWFFENTTGRLRFVKDGFGVEGVDMEDGEWLTTYGDGLMISVSIAYTLKRLALHDLINFSEKFGFPGVLGRTSAARDSEGGRSMKAAVEAFGHDWSGVLYGDDGQGKLELIETKSSASSIPMPVIVERMDRKIAALYRGADLSSMSSGTQTDGTGASLQGEEADILAQDDAQMISEALNHYLDRPILAYHYGPNVRRLAYVQIVVPEKEDQKFRLECVQALVSLGMPIAISDAQEMFGFPQPEAGAELLAAAAPVAADPVLDEEKGPAANARAVARRVMAAPQVREFIANSQRLLGPSFAAVMEHITPSLNMALSGDDSMFLTRIHAIQASLPQVLADTGIKKRAANAFLKIFSTALVNGLTENAT